MWCCKGVASLHFAVHIVDTPIYFTALRTGGPIARSRPSSTAVAHVFIVLVLHQHWRHIGWRTIIGYRDNSPRHCSIPDSEWLWGQCLSNQFDITWMVLVLVDFLHVHHIPPDCGTGERAKKPPIAEDTLELIAAKCYCCCCSCLCTSVLHSSRKCAILPQTDEWCFKDWYIYLDMLGCNRHNLTHVLSLSEPTFPALFSPCFAASVRSTHATSLRGEWGTSIASCKGYPSSLDVKAWRECLSRLEIWWQV